MDINWLKLYYLKFNLNNKKNRLLTKHSESREFLLKSKNKTDQCHNGSE